VEFIHVIAIPVIVFGGLMSLAPVLVLGERRISAFIQNRLGPNRVGPMGLLQPLADVIKLLFKEEIYPQGIEKGLYFLAPALAFIPAAFAFTTIPVGRGIQIADMNIGVLFVITATSLGVYGISLGGWASNNKFSLLGGLRSNAQVISYEIAMGLALISILMLSGSLHFQTIVENQVGILNWNIWKQPIAFIIFFIAAFAENNRLPFDLPECESELVGGYHTEYSSMKFAMFFLGEYIAMITMSALLVSLFLGGWDPGFELPDTLMGTAISVLTFVFKVLVILFVYIWVRWTLPRFRYDQLMRLGWKVLIPLALINIVLTAIGIAIFESIKDAS
jgi:NADH-quinone oxidoreductase subunit H